MPRALLLLLGLRFGSWLRRLKQAVKTKRGAALVILALVIFAPLVILPFIDRPTADYGLVRDVVPLVLLGATLVLALSMSAKILSFRPPEIDFLFAAPFSRRHLLVYKMVDTGLGGVALALFIGIWQLRHFPSIAAALIGIWFAYTFIQLLLIALILLRKAIADPAAATNVRATALVGVTSLVLVTAIGVIEVVASVASGGAWSFTQVTHAARESTIISTILIPFDVLTLAMTAERISDFALWGAVSAGMIALLFALVVRLDAFFLETSLAATRRMSRTIDRARTSGMVGKTSSMQLNLPLLWLGGAGPIAWRQLINAIRNYRGVLFLLVMFAGMPALMLFVVAPGDGEPVSEATHVIFPAAIGFMLLFAVPTTLRFDFRADFDMIDTLKSMPVPSRAVAIGQLLTPAVLLTVVTWVFIVAITLLFGYKTPVAVAGMLLAIPLSLLLATIENVVFLLYPVRPPSGNPADIALMARMMLSMFVKGLALFAALGVAAGTGVLGWLLGGWGVGAALAWFALLVVVASLIPLMAVLYDRFDVSRDTPA